MSDHWTSKLKAENDILKASLKTALSDLSLVVESRLLKEATCPAGGDYGTGYVACIQEIQLRMDEVKNRVWDDLVSKGIDL